MSKPSPLLPHFLAWCRLHGGLPGGRAVVGCGLLLGLVLSASGPALAQAGSAGARVAAAAASSDTSVYIEELTSPELRDRIKAGATTVLIPIGGTEQNGPHMVLGKHNVRVHLLGGQIARKLGNAVVAPVLAYVPEGGIRPPQAHMRYSGTISLPEPVFEGVLEAAARSFKQHGFRDVVFIGDHGGYQKSLQRVAAHLNHEWAKDPACQVQALTEYYQVSQTSYVAELERRGHSAAEIGSHAGLGDTALALAVDPTLVRADKLAAAKAGDGVAGDARRSTAELGQLGVQHIVDASVRAIRAAAATH
jgi:creatinine amidohydrolase/Fe(II)-dependent formamide hydrolase-like protein